MVSLPPSVVAIERGVGRHLASWSDRSIVHPLMGFMSAIVRTTVSAALGAEGHRLRIAAPPVNVIVVPVAGQPARVGDRRNGERERPGARDEKTEARHRPTLSGPLRREQPIC